GIGEVDGPSPHGRPSLRRPDPHEHRIREPLQPASRVAARGRQRAAGLLGRRWVMSDTRPRRQVLWRHPDFLKLWTADTVSQVGTQVTFLALPFTAVAVLKANAFQVGLLSAVEFLPFILIGLPAGVWVDRLRRRPILIAGDLGRAVILGFVPLAYGLHVLKMWQLYPVAFLTGICTVFFDVAYQSYLPSLVRRDQIVEGNAKLETSRAGAQLAGPAVAGGLIQLGTAPVAILADAISYLWSASWVFLIRRPEPPVEAEVHGRRSM